MHTRSGATVAFWCNEGFRPSQVMNSTCTNVTDWIPQPQLHICTLVTGT